MKKFLWVSLSFLALFFAIIIISPTFFNWNNYKTVIAKQVDAYTSHNLKIEGNIEVSIVPTPKMTINNISFSNKGETNSKPIASIKSVILNINFIQLLVGKLNFEKIRLIDPIIYVGASKRKNVNKNPIANDKEKVSRPSSNQIPNPNDQKNQASIPVSFKNFIIVNGTIIYEDKERDVFEKLSQIDGEINTTSLKGPFKIQGQLQIHGTPISYRLDTSKFSKKNSLSLHLKVNSKWEKTSIEVIGNLINTNSDPQFEGTISGGGASLSNFLKAFPQINKIAPLNQQFALSGDIKLSTTTAALTELTLSLGNTAFFGDFTIDFKPKVHFSIQLAAKSLDGDVWTRKLFEMIPAKATNSSKISKSANISNLKTPRVEKKIKVVRPDINGSIILSVDTLSYRNGIIRDLSINSDLVNNAIKLNQFSFQFPGGSDVNLIGNFSGPPANPRFKGSIDLTIIDLQRVLSWLNIGIRDSLPRKLKKVSFRSRLNITDKQLQLLGMNLLIDKTRLSGAAAIALRSRPSFGLTAIVDRINLDTYFRKSYLKKTINAPLNQQPLKVNVQEKSQKQLLENQSKLISTLTYLGKFDANVDLKIKKINFKGQKLQNLNLSGTLHNAKLDLRKLSIGEFVGANISAEGKLYNLDKIPSAQNFQIKAKTKYIGPFLNFVEFKSKLNPKRLGAVTLETIINGNLLRPSIKSTVNIAKAKINAEGQLSLLPTDKMFTVLARFQHSDLPRLIRNFGVKYTPSKRIGPTDLIFNLSGDPDSIKISDFHGNIGKISLKGTGQFTFASDKSKLHAKITTSPLLINDLLPTKLKAKHIPDWPNIKKIPVTWPGIKTRKFTQVDFPSKPPKQSKILTELETFDAKFEINSPSITYRKFTLEKATLIAAIKDGEIKVSPLVGKLFGGTFNGHFLITPKKFNKINSSFKLTRANLHKVLIATSGVNSTNGQLNLDLNVITKGNRETELISNLGGKLRFVATDVIFDATEKSSAFNKIYTLINFLNGKKEETLTKNLTFTGSFEINKGLAKSKDLEIKSALGKGNAIGTINLKKSKLNLIGKIDLKHGLFGKILKKQTKNNNQHIPFSIVGSLNAPTIKINTATVFRSNLKNPFTKMLVAPNPKKIKKTLKKVIKKTFLQKLKNLKTDPTNQKNINIKPTDILKQFLK